MCFNAPTLGTIALLTSGLVASAPVLYRGFARRGKGVVYEKNFVIQRAPQYATLVCVALIALGYLASNGLIDKNFAYFFCISSALPPELALSISWLGNLLFLSGLIFMIGGWYSLGEYFSTDAEVLDGHKVRRSGLLQFVMHPAYSGIIQCLLGTAIGGLSLVAFIFAVMVVAPLWLKRAKYEEGLLLEALGPEYAQYGEDLKWRRLVPIFIPIGV